ncbi:MAG: YbgC/FadM family acyl-CoA thioesterase [Chitinivibrionia bacterium]|nr:YbgC/FadM family acyl-CoA thioesterase [Chitinivibrionia bacterium]
MSTINVRIYYEDTDLSGVVYHSNYLKYMERGRTEYLRDHKIDLDDYHKEGVIFAVTEIKIQYRYPARYNDLLRVETELESVSSYQVAFRAEIFNQDGKCLSKGVAKVVAVDENTGNAIRLPEKFTKIADKILGKTENNA